MSGELTTAQVADYLGVKVQTVYAYVSRGVLAPVRREAGTGSLFALGDVQAVAEGAGRSGRRARRRATSDDVRTAITEIGPGSLAFRGRDVQDLVGGPTPWSFEEVRDLLTGVPRDQSSPLPDLAAQVRAVVAALPDGSWVLDRLKHAVLVAGVTDVGRHDRSPAAFAEAGARAAQAMVAALAGEAGGVATTDAGVGAAESPGLARALSAYLDVPTDLLDLALVLLADHDLAVSTTAVRVAVSAGSDPYSALLAGLAAADSPVHLGASARAVDWLRGALDDPRSALDAALAAGPPPGFGHVVYTEQDPRAQLLLERLLPGCPPGVRSALTLLESELADRRGWVLTVDVALALLVLRHGLPRDAGSVIFACARSAGWTAHAIEELAEPAMRFRLRGLYTGPRG